MTFPDLIKELKKLKIREMRFDSPEYFEAVLFSNENSKLDSVLRGFFGPAAKPAGAAPSREVLLQVDRFGGIRSNQTLYFLSLDGFNYYAMIWPWGDRTMMTLKMHKIEPGKPSLS